MWRSIPLRIQTGQHTLAVTLATSDEALAEIKAFADREQLSAAH